MIEAYGLALAHLSELKRRKDEESARYDRGLAQPVAPRGPGLMKRLGQAMTRAASLARGMVPPMRPREWHGGAGPAACENHGACGRAAA
jgi:hypothetical protein